MGNKVALPEESVLKISKDTDSNSFINLSQA